MLVNIVTVFILAVLFEGLLVGLLHSMKKERKYGLFFNYNKLESRVLFGFSFSKVKAYSLFGISIAFNKQFSDDTMAWSFIGFSFSRNISISIIGFAFGKLINYNYDYYYMDGSYSRNTTDVSMFGFGEKEARLLWIKSDRLWVFVKEFFIGVPMRNYDN